MTDWPMENCHTIVSGHNCHVQKQAGMCANVCVFLKYVVTQ